jgi:ketosteroid isomerase-like protein
MKKLLMMFSLVLVLCFAFACQQAEQVAEEPAVDVAAEETAIREVIATADRAARTKDVELFMTCVADDVLLASGRDHEATREWYSNWFAEGNYWDNGTIDKIEFSSSGDIAYTVCSWDMFNEEGSRGKGRNVIVWKKQADGSWKQAAW